VTKNNLNGGNVNAFLVLTDPARVNGNKKDEDISVTVSRMDLSDNFNGINNNINNSSSNKIGDANEVKNGNVCSLVMRNKDGDDDDNIEDGKKLTRMVNKNVDDESNDMLCRRSGLDMDFGNNNNNNSLASIPNYFNNIDDYYFSSTNDISFLPHQIEISTTTANDVSSQYENNFNNNSMLEFKWSEDEGWLKSLSSPSPSISFPLPYSFDVSRELSSSPSNLMSVSSPSLQNPPFYVPCDNNCLLSDFSPLAGTVSSSYPMYYLPVLSPTPSLSLSPPNNLVQSSPSYYSCMHSYSQLNQQQQQQSSQWSMWSSHHQSPFIYRTSESQQLQCFELPGVIDISHEDDVKKSKNKNS
jgi:hypothetical protein